jgi:hypothetical protein
VKREYALENCIFETVVGSQAYGTNTPESDEDSVGVMIPGPEYFQGFKRVEEFSDFEGVDRKIYAIHKAISLLLENNPNMLDLLWSPERCIKMTSPWWERILEHREKFLSKKCRYTFSGYAIAQLHRIKIHRKFLLDPPKSVPTRKEMGLPDDPVFPTSQLKAVCYAAIDMIPEDRRHEFLCELDQIYGDWVIPLFARFLDPEQRKLAMEWLQMGITAQVHAFQAIGTQYLKDEYYEMARKEAAFLNRKTEWGQYQQWSKSRNKKRAALEEKFGIDTKHAMHLVRLCRMGQEILETGKVNVDRTSIDAEELKAIRDGAWAYERIEQYATDMDKRLEELYQTSKLPRSPDIDAVQNVCFHVVMDYHSSKAW